MTLTDIGRDLVIGSGVYVGLLLLLGAIGRKAKKANTLSDHFLAGRSIGFLVLLLTLFATQYSGNSLSGFPGKTYREGLAYVMSVTFMIGIVTGYTLFAPTLFRLGRLRRYITPTDFLTDRYGGAALHYVSAAAFVFVLCNFLLAQLMAMGHAFAGITEGRIPYTMAVVAGAAVILIYELLGGMRAVAWTDALQGTMLATGLLIAAVLLSADVGSPAEVLRTLERIAPEKVASPDLETCLVWLSTFLLLGLGAPLYPQAIQRIYAARSLAQLRRALTAMALLPLVAITTVVFIGLAGITLFPGLDRIESDRITFLVLSHLLESTPAAYALVIVVMLAVVAAIMSTADSCLLSLSSILTKDVAARLMGVSHTDANRMTRLAPVFSVGAMVLLASIAVVPRITLWGLLVIKFEVLIQMSPAFVLGCLHDREHPGAVRSGEILAGLFVGLATFFVLYASGVTSVRGLHPGTLGVVANYATVCAGWWLRLRLRRRAGSPKSAKVKG